MNLTKMKRMLRDWDKTRAELKRLRYRVDGRDCDVIHGKLTSEQAWELDRKQRAEEAAEKVWLRRIERSIVRAVYKDVMGVTPSPGPLVTR